MIGCQLRHVARDWSKGRAAFQKTSDVNNKVYKEGFSSTEVVVVLGGLVEMTWPV